MSKPRGFMFACNDHRNGMFVGRFDSVCFYLGDRNSYSPPLVELEGPWTKMSFPAKKLVKIGRETFAHSGMAEWVGNWCWNEITFAEPTRLLRYLKKRGFTCVGGPTLFYERFNRQPAASQEPTEDQ